MAAVHGDGDLSWEVARLHVTYYPLSHTGFTSHEVSLCCPSSLGWAGLPYAACLSQTPAVVSLVQRCSNSLLVVELV